LERVCEGSYRSSECIMLYAVYVGNHDKDTFLVRMGWKLTRLVQQGKYRKATHMECIHEGTDYTDCTIASSSIRRGGVGTVEHTKLTPGNWRILNVPDHDVETSKVWFKFMDGYGYNIVAAVATRIHFLQPLGEFISGFFCNWACLAAFNQYAAYQSPSDSVEMLFESYGAVDITAQFFNDTTISDVW
jgi:hypothetical protein